MKVIDLLNKIANGEEVPYRIIYNGEIYEYVEEMKWYLRDDMKCELNNSKKCLNDEVETIEEDKKIKTIDCWYSMEDIKNNPELYNIMFVELKDKINEIIDYLEENK